LLAIESQMAQYVAGLAQQIALVLLVLIPTLEAPVQVRQVLRFASLPHRPGSRTQNPRRSLAGAAAVSRRVLGE
jgi:hypothetical protein